MSSFGKIKINAPINTIIVIIIILLVLLIILIIVIIIMMMMMIILILIIIVTRSNKTDMTSLGKQSHNYALLSAGLPREVTVRPDHAYHVSQIQ